MTISQDATHTVDDMAFGIFHGDFQFELLEQLALLVQVDAAGGATLGAHRDTTFYRTVYSNYDYGKTAQHAAPQSAIFMASL